jgi:hypothetical protein
MFSILFCYVLSSLPNAAAFIAEIQIRAGVMSLAVFVFILYRLRLNSR